jgi:hypothetical protein
MLMPLLLKLCNTSIVIRRTATDYSICRYGLGGGGSIPDKGEKFFFYLAEFR